MEKTRDLDDEMCPDEIGQRSWLKENAPQLVGKNIIYISPAPRSSLVSKIAQALRKFGKTVTGTRGVLDGNEYIYVFHNPTNVGGMETYILTELKTLLARNNITIHLVCVANDSIDLRKLALYDLEVGKGAVEFHVVSGYAHVAGCIEQLSRDRKIAYLVCHSPWDTVTDAALDAAQKCKIESIVYYHGGDDPMRIRYLAYPKNRTVNNLKRADRVAVVSQAGLRLVKSLDIAEDKIVMAGPMINVRAFYPSSAANRVAIRNTYSLNHRFVFLSPSRTTRLKGQLELLKAAAILKQENINDFVIAMFEIEGNDFADKLREVIVKQGLVDNIIFAKSPLPQTELRNWYAASNAVVLPSYTEGFGLVLAEAQLVQIPVIGTNAIGILEAMLDNKTGFIAEFNLCFDPSSPVKEAEVTDCNSRSLAAAMKKMMSLSPSQREKMGRAGRRFILDNFAPEKVVAKAHEVMLAHRDAAHSEKEALPFARYDLSGKTILVFSTQYFTANGVSKHVEAINRMLLERYPGLTIHMFYIVHSNTNVREGYEDIGKGRIYYYPYQGSYGKDKSFARKEDNDRFYEGAKEVIAKNHIDLIRIHSPQTGFAVMLLDFAKSSNIPLFAQWHSGAVETGEEITDSHLRKVMTGADVVVTVARVSVEEIKRKYGRDAIYIGSIRELEMFDPALVTAEIISATRAEYGFADRTIILSPNRVSSGKGTLEAIQAIESLKERRPNLLLVIIGTADEKSYAEQVEKYIASQGLSEFVKILPSTTDIVKIRNLYGVCAVVLMPSSLSEGTSGVLLEAQTMQKPIITTPIGGNPGAIVVQKTGLLVRFLRRIKGSTLSVDAQRLSQAIEKVLSSPGNGSGMGLKGRAFVLQKFAPAFLIAQHVKACEIAMGRAAGTRPLL